MRTAFRTAFILTLLAPAAPSQAALSSHSPVKCTSMISRCIIEIGGICDRETGRRHYRHDARGVMAFDTCLDRRRAARAVRSLRL